MPVLPGNGDTVADVTELVRAMMNDRAFDSVTQALLDPAVWTDPILLPFLNSAYRRFQRDLAARGVKTMVTDVIITVPAGTTVIDGVTGNPPLLPTDFLFPWKLTERPTGSTQPLSPMTPWDIGLPDRDQQTQLRDWQYVSDGIGLVGATASNDVYMRYEKALPKLTVNNSGGDPLRILGAIDAIAAGTAQRAARARGVAALSTDFKAMYEEELALWLTQYYHPKQRTPARRRPYGSRRRGIKF
jgi:hypothetical protein